MNIPADSLADKPMCVCGPLAFHVANRKGTRTLSKALCCGDEHAGRPVSCEREEPSDPGLWYPHTLPHSVNYTHSQVNGAWGVFSNCHTKLGLGRAPHRLRARLPLLLALLACLQSLPLSQVSVPGQPCDHSTSTTCYQALVLAAAALVHGEGYGSPSRY